MRNSDFNSYFDDTEESPKRPPKFRVPFYVRIIEFFASIKHLVRRSIGWAIWKCLNTLRPDRAVDAVAGFFRAIQQAIDWILLRTIFSKQSEKVAAARTGLLKRIAFAQMSLMVKVGKWSEKSAFLRWLFWPLRLISPVLRETFSFLIDWLSTRRYRQLVLGVPVIAMSALMAVTGVLIPLKSNQAKARHYLAAARVAVQNDDLAAAKLYQRKVTQLQGDGENTIFAAATLAAKSGNIDEAYQEMKKLAPLDKIGGSPRAHLWIADAILYRKLETDRPMETVKEHLDRALEFDAANRYGLEMLARYYQLAGKPHLQIETLKRIRPRNREDRYHLEQSFAMAFNDAQMPQKAKEHILRSADGFKEIVEQDETAAPKIYIKWANARFLLGHESQGFEILKKGLTQHPADEALFEFHRNANLNVLKNLPTDPESDARRLKIARRLMSVEPNNPDVLETVAALSTRRVIHRQIIGLLQPLIDSNKLSADVYGTLAMAALGRNETSEARELYETAFEQGLDDAVALNNLAWLLAHYEPIDLERGLKLIDEALERAPSNASIHGTRGHILVKQSRWQDAIPELEFGLNGMPNNQKAHRALALAYSKIGKPELAKKHQSMLTSTGE